MLRGGIHGAPLVGMGSLIDLRRAAGEERTVRDQLWPLAAAQRLRPARNARNASPLGRRVPSGLIRARAWGASMLNQIACASPSSATVASRAVVVRGSSSRPAAFSRRLLLPTAARHLRNDGALGRRRTGGQPPML